jgi:hypothetical protein
MRRDGHNEMWLTQFNEIIRAVQNHEWFKLDDNPVISDLLETGNG